MHILLITRHHTREKLTYWAAGQSLIEGLEEAGFTFECHAPWEPFEGDLTRFDAAISWPYSGKRRNFVYWAKQFEQRCFNASVPVFGSAEGCFYTHTYCYDRWAAAGIPCPKYQHFDDVDDITLDYPLILRTDDQHEARNMFLVRSRAEAAAVIARQWRLYDETRRRRDLTSWPLDIAIEYHDVKAEDGHYHKRRTIVVGDTQISREHSVSSDWVVNLTVRTASALVLRLNREFIERGEDDPDLIQRAARALGTDIVALDYSRKRDGSYIFWEGNRNFKMHGNKGFLPGQINPCTSRTYDEMVDVDRAVGRAIVAELRKRVGANAMQCSA